MAEADDRARAVYEHLRELAQEGDRRLLPGGTGWRVEDEGPPRVAYEVPSGEEISIRLYLEEDRWELRRARSGWRNHGILRFHEDFGMIAPHRQEAPTEGEATGFATNPDVLRTDNPRKLARWLRNRAEERNERGRT